MGPETFPDFLFEFGKPKLRRQIQMREKPGFPAHSHVSWEVSPKAGMAGWRRSTDRAGLRANSLQTGNFTGKYAVWGLAEIVSALKTAVPQRLFEYFPKRINRENSLGERRIDTTYQGIKALHAASCLKSAYPSTSTDAMDRRN